MRRGGTVGAVGARSTSGGAGSGRTSGPPAQFANTASCARTQSRSAALSAPYVRPRLVRSRIERLVKTVVVVTVIADDRSVA
jgi:hypothetical protein